MQSKTNFQYIVGIYLQKYKICNHFSVSVTYVRVMTSKFNCHQHSAQHLVMLMFVDMFLDMSMFLDMLMFLEE